jgi:hypothetical protein
VSAETKAGAGPLRRSSPWIAWPPSSHADIPHPAPRPTLPAPNVLLNASPDFLQRGVLLIKPSEPFLKCFPSGRHNSRGALLRNPISENVNPSAIRPGRVRDTSCLTAQGKRSQRLYFTDSIS